MARGGARNRSGPAKDPNSGASARAGYVLSKLPAAGYPGPIPDFPLPKRPVLIFIDKGEYEEDEGETEHTWERELELWTWAWRQPQGCAWISAEWRWQAVAMWVRTYVLCEGPNATAADKNSLHRFADQIGLTPAGLKENGWGIADPVVGIPADEGAEVDEEDEDDPRRRFKVYDGTGGS